MQIVNTFLILFRLAWSLERYLGNTKIQRHLIYYYNGMHDVVNTIGNIGQAN